MQYQDLLTRMRVVAIIGSYGSSLSMAAGI